MAHRSLVDVPTLNTRPADGGNPMNPAPLPLHPVAGVWCGGGYPDRTAAGAFAHGAPTEKQANQAGGREAASPVSVLDIYLGSSIVY